MRKLLSLLLVVALMPFALAGCQNQGANVSANRTNAEVWVQNTLPGYTLAGFSSATLDADNDGYISVDITVKKHGTSELTLLQLDCPTAGKPLTIQKGDGCKFKQMAFTPKF